jgi:NhaA family Na+:H+ antiporter
MVDDISVSRDRILPVEALAGPFVRFAKLEAASGIVLLASTVAALICANSHWEHLYHEFWNTQVSVGLGSFSLSEARHEWINDGLMSIFFFLVGLEIKREVLIGELSSLRQAAFPFLAALGGTMVPALVYVLVTLGSNAQKGWGIAMATDIAFALGVLALFGSRVPVSLKIFVTALAIVDDMIAVLVIAVFYTDRIHMVSLAMGLAGVAVSFIANLLGVRKPAFYVAIGVCIWWAVLESGVHATVAGILLAFTIPARTYVDRDLFLERSRRLLNQFEGAEANSRESHDAIHTLEAQCELIESPLHRIEHYLHPWVGFLIMPLFAFANAGVRIWGKGPAALTHPASLGVALGLLIGKPLGIWLFAWLSLKTGLATPPAELSPYKLLGASCLCGIGFTMSLFIANLAFGEGLLLDMAKIGTLVGSLAAGVLASAILLRGSSDRAAKDDSG